MTAIVEREATHLRSTGGDLIWQVCGHDRLLGIERALADTGFDCPFAGLFDGGVIPKHWGKGLYRAIVADRAAEAVRRGARYLNANVRETSLRILERLGFELLTTMHQWLLKAPSRS